MEEWEKDELTEEEYAIAESNGIHRKLAKFRYEQGGFGRNRAITQPVRQPKNWAQYKDEAEKNGVSQHLFYKRIGKDVGWTPERAASTPPYKPGQFYGNKKVIPQELVERAAANGISKTTLYQRLFRYHLDEETAVNRPIGKRRKWNHVIY